MQTRCPHCQTRFRVTTEQLKLRQGQVRCGACHEVFDALDSLSDEPLVIVAPPEAGLPELLPESQPLPDGTVAPQPEPVPVEPVIPVTEIEAAANEAGALEPEPEPALEPEPLAEPELAPAITPESEGIPDVTVPDEPTPAEAAVTETPAPTEEWQPVPAVKPARRWPWALGSLALLLAAAVQLAYLFRVELAVVVPATRPVLVAGCELFGCNLPRPRKPDQVGIETSDLAPEGTGLLLTAVLKNRAPFDQDYPHLELTLTDTLDEALVRKILPPVDYLPAGQDAAQGFAARGEVTIRLSLTTDNVPAVGYRLYLFYP